jgi:hypothetical protein
LLVIVFDLIVFDCQHLQARHQRSGWWSGSGGESAADLLQLIQHFKGICRGEQEQSGLKMSLLVQA